MYIVGYGLSQEDLRRLTEMTKPRDMLVYRVTALVCLFLCSAAWSMTYLTSCVIYIAGTILASFVLIRIVNIHCIKHDNLDIIGACFLWPMLLVLWFFGILKDSVNVAYNWRT